MPSKSSLQQALASNHAAVNLETSVTFGAVTVKVKPPAESVVRRNIEAGQAALRHAKDALITPGIKISRQKGQPLYFGSSDRPDLIIREVDGVRTFGKFTSGRFRIVQNSNAFGNAVKVAKKA